MSVPAKRASSRARKTRASHHGLKTKKITSCPKCKQPCQPHQVCKNCGYYKGRDVLNLEAKLTKRELKKKRQAEEAQNKAAAKEDPVVENNPKDEEVKTVV